MEVLIAVVIYFAFFALITLAKEGINKANQREAANKKQQEALPMPTEEKEEKKMNKLQEEILKLEEMTERNTIDELLLHILQNKAQELGEDVSDEEAEAAVVQAKKNILMLLLEKEQEQKADNENWDDDMLYNIAVVRSALEDMNLRYREYVHQAGVKAFELRITNENRSLLFKIYLEEDPRLCRIDAIFPFQADRDFAYPLCEVMAAENYPRRYGALQYDRSDGELTYRYSFPVKHGLYDDDFRTAFLSVAASAHASYDTIKQYANGRIRREQRQEVICKAQKLIIELDQ